MPSRSTEVPWNAEPRISDRGRLTYIQAEATIRAVTIGSGKSSRGMTWIDLTCISCVTRFLELIAYFTFARQNITAVIIIYIPVLLLSWVNLTQIVNRSPTFPEFRTGLRLHTKVAGQCLAITRISIIHSIFGKRLLHCFPRSDNLSAITVLFIYHSASLSMRIHET